MDRDPAEVERDMRAVFAAAVRAVDAESVVRARFRHLHSSERDFFDVPTGGRLIVVGAGKAAAAMARGVEASLGPEIDRGLVVVKDGHEEPLDRIESIAAAHPVPDERSERAAGRVAELLSGLGPEDRVLVLLTGGASSLLAAPAAGASLESKRRVTRALLRAGATIGELNRVRKHLSRLKGGRLARAAHPARVLAWVISDVVGDDPATIASGPTVPDASTPDEALDVLERRIGRTAVPDDVRSFLKAGGDPVAPFEDATAGACTTTVLASNATALEAGVVEARNRGYRATIRSRSLTGEASDVGRRLAREFLDARRPEHGPEMHFYGGETPVTVRGDGRGGRCTELVLAAAIEWGGAAGCHVAAVATDGTDGPTDAAGASAGPSTLLRARAAGLDAEEALARNDSLGFFEALGDAIVTGPTRTNVMDLLVFADAGASMD